MEYMIHEYNRWPIKHFVPDYLPVQIPEKIVGEKYAKEALP